MQRISERIEKLIESLGVTKNKFSKEIGTSSALISQIVANGKDSFRVDLIQKIVNRYPDVNVYWLMLGEGEIWRKKGSQEVAQDIDILIQGKEDEILFMHAKIVHVSEILFKNFNIKADKKVTDVIKNTITEIPYIDLKEASEVDKLHHLKTVERTVQQLQSLFWKLFSQLHVKEFNIPGVKDFL